MRHKFPNVSDYWKMKPKERRDSTSFYLDNLPDKVVRYAYDYKWFGVFGLTAKESLKEYGIAARCINLEKFEYECYAPDPDEEDCSIYFITTEGDIEEQLRKHRGLSTFLLQHNLYWKQFLLMDITEKIYVTSLHFDLIDLLGLDVDETFVRSEIELEDNEKDNDDIVIEDNKPSKREENDVNSSLFHIEDLSNLDLHEALRNIIDIEGCEIIQEVRLVNILSDYKFFETNPASKFIFKSIITEGYSKRLYSIGEWNSKCAALASHFSLITGFQSDYVKQIFISLAYGLGWISNMPSNDNSFCNQNTSQIQPLNTTIKLTTKEQKELFLYNKIRFLNDIKQETGLEVSNISFEIENSKCFKINCEIRGKVKDSCAGFYIKIVIYDEKNKIRYNDDLGFYCRNDSYFRGFNVITKKIVFPVSYLKISKIAIFV